VEELEQVVKMTSDGLEVTRSTHLSLSDFSLCMSLSLCVSSPVFQHLPEPNRACLVGVYAVTLHPLVSLYGIIYVTWYSRLLPKATRVRFQ